MDNRRRLAQLGHFLSLVLFWPGLALVIWGELTPHPPAWTAHVWDKALHFVAYFGLSAMLTLLLGLKRLTLVALLGLVLLGGTLEILQGYTGRDPDPFDEIANTIGATAGALVALGFMLLTRDGSRKAPP